MSRDSCIVLSPDGTVAPLQKPHTFNPLAVSTASNGDIWFTTENVTFYKYQPKSKTYNEYVIPVKDTYFACWAIAPTC